MGKCPICGKNIDALFLSRAIKATIWESYNVHYDQKNSTLDLTHMEERDSVEADDEYACKETYYCSICEAEVADSEEEAIKILMEGGTQ